MTKEEEKAILLEFAKKIGYSYLKPFGDTDDNDAFEGCYICFSDFTLSLPPSAKVGPPVIVKINKKGKPIKLSRYAVSLLHIRYRRFIGEDMKGYETYEKELIEIINKEGEEAILF